MQYVKIFIYFSYLVTLSETYTLVRPAQFIKLSTRRLRQ